jgi:DNA polymerase-1
VGKLVIIDGNAILHRAFHALPPLTTKNGEPINAVYGLVSMLLKVIGDLKPTHLAVCFDRPEPTFRHKAYLEYQSQRPKMANELSSQFEKAKKVLEAFGIPMFEKAGYEADDVIGTLANKVNEEVIIVTGDRDQLQLVDDRIKVYLPISGLSSAKLMGEAEVKEKMGVPPSLIDDYKALVGDPSDNYPGVAGIGPKTAIKLLEEFGSLDGIYKNLNKIPAGVSQKLKLGRRESKLSKKLATIVKDVPLEIDVEKMSKWDIDSQKVLDLFSDFGFKTLTERVKKVGKELDSEKQMQLL